MKTRLLDRTKAVSVWLARLESERDLLGKQITTDSEKVTTLRQDATEWEQARDLMVQVLAVTQVRVRRFVEEVVTKALSTIYGEDSSFELEYQQKRNQLEATPYIVIRGHRFSPRDEVGGGVLDIAALAVRIAVWAMTDPMRPAGGAAGNRSPSVVESTRSDGC